MQKQKIIRYNLHTTTKMKRIVFPTQTRIVEFNETRDF
jgi:hypothetical protein